MGGSAVDVIFKGGQTFVTNSDEGEGGGSKMVKKSVTSCESSGSN